MSKIVIVGPAHPLRGGIADFNEAFAESLIDAGHQVTIVSFKLQYPSILFPGKTQYRVNREKHFSFEIKHLINSINPISWILDAFFWAMFRLYSKKIERTRRRSLCNSR